MVQGGEVWSDISKVCQMLIMTAPSGIFGYGSRYVACSPIKRGGIQREEGYGPKRDGPQSSRSRRTPPESRYDKRRDLSSRLSEFLSQYCCVPRHR
jgi:hypothetical protein